MMKVRLKFKASAETGKLVSYVSEIQGKLYGVPETEKRKLKTIVVPDPNVQVGIVENALYVATLVPMKSAKGFIAKHIAPVVFDGSIVLDIIPEKTYRVHVEVGGLRFTYDPLNKKKRRNFFSTCDDMVKFLRKRIDINHPDIIINDFLEASSFLEASLIEDGYR